MKITSLISILLIVGSHTNAFGQIKIGSHHLDIHPASILELESKTKVLVLTQLTDQEMNLIVPLNGALVFNSSQNCLFFYEDRWVPLCEFNTELIPNPASLIAVSNTSFLFTNSRGMKTWIHIPKNKQVFAGSKKNGYESLWVQNQTDSLLLEIKKIDGHLINTNSIIPDKLSYGREKQVLMTLENNKIAWADLPIPTIHPHEHNYEYDHEHEQVSNTQSNTTIIEQTILELVLSEQDSINLYKISNGTPGTLWYTNETGLFSEIKNSSNTAPGIYWDSKYARLGIGTSKPSNKLHIAGEVRSQGFSNSNGSKNEPSYSFKSDSNTGMFRAAADQLAFSTKGNEAMRITKAGKLVLGKTTANASLDIYGSLALKIEPSEGASHSLTDKQTTILIKPEVIEVLLPLANQDNKGRIYILKNLSGHNISLNIAFVGLTDPQANKTILTPGVIWIQSDGDYWQQIL
jgi:hypothetical protein